MTLVGGSRKGERAYIAGGEMASYDWFPRPIRRGEGDETTDENADIGRLPALNGLSARNPEVGLISAIEKGDSEREEGGEISSKPCS